MKIHEYQAKAILARHGVPVPVGEVIVNAADAVAAATRLGAGRWWSRRKSTLAAAARAAA